MIDSPTPTCDRTRHDVHVSRLTRDIDFACLRRSDVPPWPTDVSTWLGPDEIRELNHFRAPRRRREWLSGRWCARVLLRETITGETFDRNEWQILSQGEKGMGCPPRLFRNRIHHPSQLSISHSDSMAVAAIANEESGRIGIDVVKNEAPPRSFEVSWFSIGERELMQRNHLSSTAFWAAKEAAFKACNRGERFRPRSIEISQLDGRRMLVQYSRDSSITVNLKRIEDSIVAYTTSRSDANVSHRQHNQGDSEIAA